VAKHTLNVTSTGRKYYTDPGLDRFFGRAQATGNMHETGSAEYRETVTKNSSNRNG